MGAIQEYGLELDDLHALLHKWMGLAVPANDDLQHKRVRMGEVSGLVQASSTGFTTALNHVNDAFHGLGGSATAEKDNYLSHAASLQSGLVEATTVREAAHKSAGSSLGQCAADNDKIRGEVKGWDEAASASFGNVTKQVAAAREGLTKADRASSTAKDKIGAAIVSMGSSLREHGTASGKLVDGLRKFFEENRTTTVPKAAGKTNEWITGQLKPGQLGILDGTLQAAAKSFDEFAQAVSKLAGEAGSAVSTTLTAAARECVEARSALSKRVSSRTTPLLEEMGRRQGAVKGTFDPGYKRIIDCAAQLGAVWHKYDAVRRNV